MKKPQRKLTINAETIRLLSSSQLERAAGGTAEELDVADEGDQVAVPKTRGAPCMNTAPRTQANCTPILDEITKLLSIA